MTTKAAVVRSGIKDDKERPALPTCDQTEVASRGATSTARPPGGWSRNIARRLGIARIADHTPKRIAELLPWNVAI